MSEPSRPVVPEPPSQVRLLKATVAALLVAGAVLVTIVLPAEYGIDPFKTGELLGLVELGQTASPDETPPASTPVTASSPAGAHAGQPLVYRTDVVQFKLGPREGMEYKYRIEQGGGLIYTWNATVPVHYELHAEPDGAPRGYAETFDKQDDRDQAHGTLLAPFSGIHGWYWENPTTQEVTVSLRAHGFYSASLEFRRDAEVKTRWFK